MKVHIIGAGIAGLSMASGLQRIGCEVVISERRDSVREVGAGISLWSNALRALDALGAGEAVRALSQPARLSEFRVNAGHRCIARLNLSEYEHSRQLAPTIWMIHRADLVGALAKLLKPTEFRWEQTLVEIQSFEDQVTAQFADGSRVMSDILVGADGIHSLARRYVLGHCRPRYSGYTCYRGICEAPASLVPLGYICEIWGHGLRFGITSLKDHRVYWWATRPAPPNESERNPRDLLRRLFSPWAAPVPQLLKMTPPNSVLTNDILDHEPRLPWHRGRIIMVGDAAHAVTPNFGQGGCLAIEDAVVFGRHLRPSVERLRRDGSAIPGITEIEKVFGAFTNARFDRCRWLAKKSNHLGELGKWTSGLAVGLRNFAIGLTPPPLMWRTMLKPTLYDAGTL
jgi:2-polyprenyl-6-methoxyphenol hydroxylase-like FAD-dependent oxidoreductase